MNTFIVYGASALAACFSSAIMTYVSLATPFGPWIEPLLLVASLVIFCGLRLSRLTAQQELLACIAGAGGVGGIAAVACSFSYPTLFFLDSVMFTEWLQHPGSFIGTLALLVLTTGGIAFGLVAVWEDALLRREDLSFPVTAIVHQIIKARDTVRKRLEFCGGVVISCVLGFLFPAIQPFTVVPACSYGWVVIPRLVFSVHDLPLFMALGFITSLNAYPLMFGLLAKIFLVQPVGAMIGIQSDQFVAGWCSGMMLYGVLEVVLKFVPRALRLPSIHWESIHGAFKTVHSRLGFTRELTLILMSTFASSALLLRFIGFSWLSVIYLWILTIISTYQLVLIAGAIGLAPLGRFALFITMPGLMLFKYSAIQTTFVATFVELCGGIAVDLMFGRKLAALGVVSRVRMIQAQIIGLVVGAVTIGLMVWLLSLHPGIGHPPLIAQRACTRALLLKLGNFNMWGIVGGMCFSFLLHRVRINVALVMSGFLMPFECIFPLLLGGLVSKIVDKKDEYFYWCSGIFVAASLVLLLKIVRGSIS